MKIKPLAPNEIEETIRRFTFQASPNQPIGPREIAYGRPDLQWSVLNRDELAGTLSNSETDAFGYYYLALETLMLDGPSRVGLINMQSAGDLQAKPLTRLQILFQDDAKRTEVRRIVRAAFGFSFVVEPTQLGHLRIRLSTREPIDELEERGIHSAAVEFHKAAFPIEEASDGVKAFTG